MARPARAVCDRAPPKGPRQPYEWYARVRLSATVDWAPASITSGFPRAPPMSYAARRHLEERVGKRDGVHVIGQFLVKHEDDGHLAYLVRSKGLLLEAKALQL